MALSIWSCNSNNGQHVSTYASAAANELKILVGADQTEIYLPLLKDKRVGLVVNQTSTIGLNHIVDSLILRQVNVHKIFSPEHGFRGDADAGTYIDSSRDPQTGIPIISIYGSSKKPSPEQLEDIDIIVFDIQDVGARFYTYLSTMHYVMEACAEIDIPVIVLDRPNPNGHYVDGPILQPAYSSFVGMHPIPIVHGMTLGELAQMINGQKWLDQGIQCQLTVIPCANYTRTMDYPLPIAPSPNLPNYISILLYPSLCLFEGTTLSIGRGTDRQFQLIGHPDLKSTFSFTPRPGPGSKNPKHNGQECFGRSLAKISTTSIKQQKGIQLDYLLDFYLQLDKDSFFNKNLYFDKLAGTDQLRKQIEAGYTSSEIKDSWVEGLQKFKMMRFPYLIYPE